MECYEMLASRHGMATGSTNSLQLFPSAQNPVNTISQHTTGCTNGTQWAINNKIETMKELVGEGERAGDCNGLNTNGTHGLIHVWRFGPQIVEMCGKD